MEALEPDLPTETTYGRSKNMPLYPVCSLMPIIGPLMLATSFVLRRVSLTSRQVTLFGVKYPSPILMAPIGVQAICHPDGESASARAAKNLGIPYILSTASSRSMEEIAKENGDGHRWYQLYW